MISITYSDNYGNCPKGSFFVNKVLNESKSNALGDASQIGLECESGDFSDCDLNEPVEHAPIGCEGILMFSENESKCGSLCQSKTTRSTSSATAKQLK